MRESAKATSITTATTILTIAMDIETLADVAQGADRAVVRALQIAAYRQMRAGHAQRVPMSRQRLQVAGGVPGDSRHVLPP